MSKVVLFSPVGGTDPISENNYYDGSLLHICRWHKPDEVYIYLSQEILNNENKDHRMVRALKLLQEKIQHSFEIHVIERPDLVNPQDFNYFFKDFRDELLNISKSLNIRRQTSINCSFRNTSNERCAKCTFSIW